jgi:hypothetical protein
MTATLSIAAHRLFLTEIVAHRLFLTEIYPFLLTELWKGPDRSLESLPTLSRSTTPMSAHFSCYKLNPLSPKLSLGGFTLLSRLDVKSRLLCISCCQVTIRFRTVMLKRAELAHRQSGHVSTFPIQFLHLLVIYTCI